jgi:outer membrane protein, heavy metal efflux system
MYNRTDPAQFRAQYEFTLGIKIPLHHDKQRAELAQAQIELDRSRSDREAQSQQLAADMRQQYLIEQQTAELLKINREGLLPQARAGYQAGLAAYRNNKQDFQALLNSYLDILRLEQENWQSLADHETALARLEQMTGMTLLRSKE